jgi:hypothetical protein
MIYQLFIDPKNNIINAIKKYISIIKNDFLDLILFLYNQPKNSKNAIKISIRKDTEIIFSLAIANNTCSL